MVDDDDPQSMHALDLEAPGTEFFRPQIIQVEDIPYTLNGKRVEVPVKKVRIVRTSRARIDQVANL